VAVRHGGLLDRLPALPRAHPARDFARETESRQLTETDVVEHLPHLLRRQHGGDLGGTDVRRFLDHFRDGQRAVRMSVGNRRDCRSSTDPVRS
jgi:hypothetical protein